MRWYHGTSGQLAKEILKEGVLKPGQDSVYDVDVPRSEAVYIASYDIAMQYAEERSFQGTKKIPGVVLEVAQPDPKKLVPDEDDVWDLLEQKGTFNAKGEALSDRVRSLWLKMWNEEHADYREQGDSEEKFPNYNNFEEAWGAWQEVPYDYSSELSTQMKDLTDYIVKHDPKLSQAIVELYGKAAHIGPIKVKGVAKKAAKKVKIVKTPGFVIEVPQERRKTFFVRPKAPLEYWAFKNRPRVFINEPLIFTFGGKPVAQATVVRVEAPGKGEGEYKHYHKVYWKPTTFKRFRVTAAGRPEVLYHMSRRTNRQSILKSGLVPQIKEYKGVERKPGVFFFQSIEAARDYGTFHAAYVNQALDVWECRIPEDYPVQLDPHPEMKDFDAWVSHKPLPPENLKVVETIFVPTPNTVYPPRYKSKGSALLKKAVKLPTFEHVVDKTTDTNGEFDLDVWRDRNLSNMDEYYEEIAPKLKALKFPLTVYRCFALREGEKIDYKQLGGSWSLSSRAAYLTSHEMFSDEEYEQHKVITGMVENPDAVDWLNTTRAWMTLPEEQEIRLKPGAKVKVKGKTRTAATTKRFYHGTPKKNLDAILKGGLKVEFSDSHNEWNKAIYLACDVHTAANYAGMHGTPDNDWVVLEIDGNKLNEYYMRPDDYELPDMWESIPTRVRNKYDDNWALMDWKDSLKYVCQCAYLADIPADAIKVHSPSKTADRVIDVGEGDEYWAGEGNAASGVLPVCPSKGTVCLAMRSSEVMTPNCWGTIGGAVQEGKSPQQSAKSEMAEEMGYHGGITLIPAYVFTDRGFSYHNFIGVVSNEFSFNPGKGFGWETDHIVWVPYQDVLEDMQINPSDYHPGVLKLFANSKDIIERALKVNRKQAWQEIAWSEDEGDLMGGILEDDEDLKSWAENEFIDKDKKLFSEFMKMFKGKRVAVIDMMNAYESGQGWGGQTLGRFIDEAQRKRCAAIVLEVGTAENEFDLKKWYERNGFKQFGKTMGLPLMVKWLKPQGKKAEDAELIKSPYMPEDEWRRILNYLNSLEWRGRNPWYPIKYPWFTINLYSDRWVASNEVLKEVLAEGTDLASLKQYLAEFVKGFGHDLKALREPKTIEMPTQGIIKREAGMLPSAPPPDASRLPCPSGKRKFFDEYSAIGPHRGLVGEKGLPYRAYQCPKCGWWHVTSKPQRQPVTAAEKKTLFHGTTWDAAQEIGKLGIKARNGWVYCTDTPGKAYEYGQSISWHELDKPEQSAVVEFVWDGAVETDPEHVRGDAGKNRQQGYFRISSDVPRPAIKKIEWFKNGKKVKSAAQHTPEYAQQLIEALKKTIHDADFKVIGSVGQGGASENDLDILVNVHPDATYADDEPWIDSSGLTGAMKLMGFDYAGSSDFSPEESTEKSEVSGKYLDPAGSGVEKFFNPTTHHTVEFWFTESMSKEADWKSKYLLPTALGLGLGLGGAPATHPGNLTPQQIEQKQQEQAKIEKQKRIDALVEAIARAEGADPDLNNPGNLVDFNTGKIKSFDSPEQGRAALAEQLERIANGDHQFIMPDMTLRDAGLVYSNGDPNWANNVSKIMHVPQDVKMGELIRGAAPSDKISAWLKSAAGFAFKSFKKLWHVGDMNPKSKQEGSLEGSGLSVSINPEEWMQIAEISGDLWELTKPGNKFLNFHRLSKQQRQQIMAWGIQNGYVTEVSAWRLTYYDDKAGEERYMEFQSQEEAEAELGSYGDDEKIVPVKDKTVSGTDKLKQRTKNQHANETVVAFDLLVTVYAEDGLDCDGVWWADTLDPLNLSAPRGVIFTGRLKSWKAKRVTSAKTASAMQPFYHGTTWAAADKINKEGLKAHKWEVGPGSFVWASILPEQGHSYGLSSSNEDDYAVVTFMWDYDKTEPDPEHGSDYTDVYRRIPSNVPRSAITDIKYYYSDGSLAKAASKTATEWKKLPATNEWINRAKLFMKDKWTERHKELGREGVPTDLKGACKFASLFAVKLFGGRMVGNPEHQVVKLSRGDLLDLTDMLNIGTFHHDKEFWMNPEHEESMKSIEPRVNQWVDEFYQKYWQDYFKHTTSAEIYLYHGTTDDNLDAILANGITAPSFWGTAEMADYFAKGAAEESGTPVIFKLPMSRFDKSKFVVDNVAIQEPITMALGRSEEELYEMWQQAKGTWQDSLRIYESVKYNAPVKVTEKDIL